MSSDIFEIVFLIIFNASIITSLYISLRGADFKGALVDKDARMQAVAANQAAAALPVGQAAAVALPSLDNEQFTSSSRIAVMTGISVLASFLWALGNIIIFKSFVNIQDIHTLLINVWPYFLAGSALFAPYAFSQIKTALS